MRELVTDYLVVGAGASGMGFTDALVADSDADVVLLDRRHAPGGHWHDAYPFVRLHQPSAFYGVNSRPLGDDRIDSDGENAGFYERAGAAAVRDHLEQALERELLPSGQVRFFGMAEYLGGEGDRHRFVSRLSGRTHEVRVRRKLVDTGYARTEVPATHPPSFPVDPAVPLVPVGGLAGMQETFDRYVILGSGKTAMDACVFLLGSGVDPDRIRWVRPRDAWLLDRAGLQPLDHVGSIVEGFSLDLEALAHASSLEDLFDRLEASGRLLRIDRGIAPTMYRCGIVSRAEVAELRRIEDVVRLGRVVRIDADAIVLEHGSVATDRRHLHVDCTARGIGARPAQPVFEPGRITLQQIRPCTPSFNAALIGHVEATRDDLAEQNRLCPPSRVPSVSADWLGTIAGTLATAHAWRAEADLVDWAERARVNPLRGLGAHLHESRVQQAVERIQRNRRAAIAKLHALGSM